MKVRDENFLKSMFKIEDNNKDSHEENYWDSFDTDYEFFAQEY